VKKKKKDTTNKEEIVWKTYKSLKMSDIHSTNYGAYLDADLNK
jgi:hypothetical protein